jgi:protein SCO1/2
MLVSRRSRSLLWAVLLLAPAGCQRPAPPAPAPAETLKTFEGRGVLLEASPDGRRARIAHEKIPGYMEAMTMEFAVRDPEGLGRSKPGTILAFRVCITDREGWIDHVRPVGETALPAAAQMASRPRRDQIDLPHCRLVDQFGKPYAFGEERGTVIALSFIFTRCPYPEFCPRLSRAFSAVQDELSRSNPDEPWRLLSVTIDPAYDTPSRLAEYAAQYQADPRHWLFLTGDPAEVQKLASAAGLSIAENGALPEHTLRTLLVNQAGRVVKTWDGNEWSPQELAGEMRRVLAPPPKP